MQLLAADYAQQNAELARQECRFHGVAALMIKVASKPLAPLFRPRSRPLSSTREKPGRFLSPYYSSDWLTWRGAENSLAIVIPV